MGKTKRGSKGPGYDYWSGRPGPTVPGKGNKKITHSIERQQAKNALRKLSDNGLH